MAIHHGHACTGGADAHWQRLQASRCDLAEDFADLAPDFLFFLGDIGNNIVDDVEAEHPTIAASAGDSLKRRHDHTINPKSSGQRRQGDHQSHRRTVRIWRHKTFPATLLTLVCNESGMVVVDTRDQERYVLLI